MRYEVTLRGPRSAQNRLGTIETVIVEADSGDEAAAAAFRPYRIICGVRPAPMEAEPTESRAALRAEYSALVGKAPFNGWDEAALRAKIEAAKQVNA